MGHLHRFPHTFTRGLPLILDTRKGTFTNDLSTLLRHRLYDCDQTSSITLLIHNPTGLPLLPYHFSHLLHIFADSPSMFLAPERLTNKVFPLQHFLVDHLHRQTHNFASDQLDTFPLQPDLYLHQPRPIRGSFCSATSTRVVAPFFQRL